jgi:hypothetical protein
MKNLKLIPLWAWAVLLGAGIVLGVWLSDGDNGCDGCGCDAGCCDAGCCDSGACAVEDCACACKK